MLSELEETINARRRIYLIRHGDVSYFDDSGEPYRPDVVPLNEVGRRQAEALREAFEAIPLDRVVSTGLVRADQTAEILARGRGIEIECVPDLREIAPGPLVRDRPPGYERELVNALRWRPGAEDRFLGGETFRAHAERVLRAFEALLARHDWRRIAIVAHGGTNRVILLHALGAPLDALGNLEQDAAAVNVIDADLGGAFLVRLVNYTTYAPLKEGLHLTTMERILFDHVLPGRTRDEGGGVDEGGTGPGAGRTAGEAARGGGSGLATGPARAEGEPGAPPEAGEGACAADRTGAESGRGGS